MDMHANWLTARPHLSGLASKMQALLELADTLWTQGRADGGDVDYARFEEDVAKRTAEVECAVHEVALSGLDVDAPFVMVWGKTYRRVHRTTRQYGTLAGNATVERTLYREVGVRSGPALDPVATRAGVVDGSWLPRTARAMAHLIAQVTSREAESTSGELVRLPYSRSSFERVGHEVGKEYMQRRRTLEPRLIEALEVPAEARSISVSVDRVAVPMEEAREAHQLPRPPMPAKLQRMARKNSLGLKVDERTKKVMAEAERVADEHPRKVNRNFRMAYCGTVTLHDETGRALHTIRYGRMPPAQDSSERYTHRGAHELMQRMRDDVVSLRARRPELPVVLLADGAAEMWNLLGAHLNERTLGVAPVELVDVWHVLEYVAAAAKLLDARGRTEPGSFRRWKAMLLEGGRDGARSVRDALDATGGRELRDADGQRPVHDAIRYLDNRTSRMDYAGARARGLAIGSGAVEATCKSLVAIRMKRAGSRWKAPTGNEVLTLRALQLSDRWEAGVTGALRPLAKAVRVAKAPPRRSSR
jgi:hypothetical protein